eukprot:5659988-Lingulodinium_polyedra.AAC.1
MAVGAAAVARAGAELALGQLSLGPSPGPEPPPSTQPVRTPVLGDLVQRSRDGQVLQATDLRLAELQ